MRKKNKNIHMYESMWKQIKDGKGDKKRKMKKNGKDQNLII